MIHESGDLPAMFSIPSYGDIRRMVSGVSWTALLRFYTMKTYDAFLREGVFFYVQMMGDECDAWEAVDRWLRAR